MNEFTAKKGIRSVRKIEELPEGTVYYSKEEEWKSRCSCGCAGEIEKEKHT